jgi:hypothetical protein
MAHVPAMDKPPVVVLVVCSDTIRATRRAQALARPDCVAYKIRHEQDGDDDDMCFFYSNFTPKIGITWQVWPSVELPNGYMQNSNLNL